MDLYLHDCNKKLVKEKDNNELDVMDVEPMIRLSHTLLMLKQNVHASADDEGDDEGSDDSDSNSDEDY